MSFERAMQGGRAVRDELPTGETGRCLCRWCALEVPRGRFTFCSDWCVHEWRLRSNPGYLREQVLRRDKGICSDCGIDTLSAYRQIRKARGSRRSELLARWGLKRATRRSLWDADHILPVAEGGGECELANLRTLCLLCHRKATAELRLRLRKRGKLPDTVPAGSLRSTSEIHAGTEMAAEAAICRN
jgi:5-methylcytosine-specific restriction enzyme A